MTNFETDPGQTQQPGSYQPWPGESTGNAAQQYSGPPQQQPGQYPTQYAAQQYPVQYQPQQYPAQYQPQQYPQQYQPYQGAPYGYPAAPKSNGLGTGGFVCGLLGLLLFWIPVVGLILAIIGIALGGSGMASGKRDNAPTGLAIAGVVLGALGLVLSILLIAAIVSL